MNTEATHEKTDIPDTAPYHDASNEAPGMNNPDTTKPRFIWLRRMIIQVPLLIGLILSLLLATLTYHLAKEEAEYFENIFLQQDIALANAFSANPDFYLLQEHQESFTDLLRGWISAIPSIESVTICQTSGEMISHYSIEEYHNSNPCENIPEYNQTGSKNIVQNDDYHITTYHQIVISTGHAVLKVVRAISVISDLKEYVFNNILIDGAIIITIAIISTAIILLSLLRRINCATEFSYNLRNNTGDILKETKNLVEIYNLEKGLNHASTVLYRKNNYLTETCNRLVQQHFELLELKNNLEEKVNDRVHELNVLNSELERSNKVKSDFMSLVSHELRSPLTSIKSFSEIMLDDIDNHDPETTREYLNIINNETSRLARLINDILDLQKINEGKMVWRDALNDIHKITEDAAKLFSEAYRKKGVDLKIVSENDLPLLNIDADKAKQIFSNLLSNALKFSTNGKVEITLSQNYNKGKNSIMIAVTDYGPGIPDDEIGKIFDRFYQVERNRQSNIVGSGLGLNICAEIVSHYQGEIWVESDGKNGSTFYITLPVDRKYRKPIGEILVESGAITKDHLDEALMKQNESD